MLTKMRQKKKEKIKNETIEEKMIRRINHAQQVQSWQNKNPKKVEDSNAKSKEKIRNAINDVAHKQRDAIKKWESDNPLWQQK